MCAAKEYVASRVSVFDAATLDKEIESFLRNQIDLILGDLLYNGTAAWGPEIEAGLKILLWLFSVERQGATFGQQLLKLRYTNNVSTSKLRVLGLLLIGLPYFKARSQQFKLTLEKFPNWFNFVLSNSQVTLGTLNLIAFIAFLRRGGTPLFIEKALGIIPVATVKPFERSIGYAYITRELLWHGTIELFCLLLPHINVPKLNRIARHFVFGKQNISLSPSPPVFTCQDKCSLCRLSPVIPHTIGCQHFFCYFCISSALLSDQKFECPSCSYSNPTGVATAYVSPLLVDQC